MSNIVVKAVETKKEQKLFLNFPWQLYHGDPNWVPPLRNNQKGLVGFARHPFYERNRSQAFLAFRNGEVAGRILAIINQGHIQRFREQRGFFGFFESVDDERVAHGLFDAARQWLSDHGIESLRGPTNPSLNYELGLLIEGFDTPPNFMMTYNPPYYQRLIESYGFRKTQDLYAYWGHVSMLPEIRAKLKPICDKIVERYDVKVRMLNKKRFLEDVELFLEIYNRSLVNTWGFVPMTPAEVRHMAKGLRWLMVPELALGAEIDGRMVGAVFCLPNYNPRIKDIDGRLFPFGFIHLLRNKQAIKSVRVISTNVLPEYHLMGLGVVLLDGLVPKAMEWGIVEAEFSWVLESNALSRGSLEKGGAKRTKTYRLYDYGG